MKPVRKKIVLALAALALLAVWLVVNPPGRFGICRFAWTTYGGIPYPLGDLQVRADGKVRRVTKAHILPRAQVDWLLDPAPEVLIIATGWDGVVRPAPEIGRITGCEVKFLTTGEAIALYNSLKGRKRVAIHLHSTC